MRRARRLLGLLWGAAFLSAAPASAECALLYDSLDDAASIAAIRRSIERGITWLDPSRFYALGHWEEIVARALAEIAAAEADMADAKR